MKYRCFANLALLLFAAVAAQGETSRPNVLFLLTEDQGAHMGFLGTPGLRTPHMDALARSGVYFDNAFVAYPVCSASKAALYTGLHNHANGIMNNTPNVFKPADELTSKEAQNALYLKNRIRPGIPTLIERLHEAGYYQAVTGKLHVAPVEKFPFDEFIRRNERAAFVGFMERAAQAGKPWHLFCTIADSHRPFPNSDKEAIAVDPKEVKLPACLPDTPVMRKDWAEYLAAIEEADVFVGMALDVLRSSGQEDNTVVVFMGDHGPAFAHGKMTLYDLGLRVPLIIRAPGMFSGMRTEALASELDLTPTLLDLLGLAPMRQSHGLSLEPLLADKSQTKGHEAIFAEISDRGPLPNDGMQERSVFDGRWHLIYREKLTPAWRTVQADSKYWKTWRNRSYDETLLVKDRFPEAFRILTEMDPQSLGGRVPSLELYDRQTDPDELHNRAGDSAARPQRDRLYAALRQWIQDTNDVSVQPPFTPQE